MDNRIFNVNGETRESLKKTLDLAFTQGSYEGKYRGPEAWIYDPKYGLVLLWSSSQRDSNKFPSRLNLDALVDVVWQWLKSEEAKAVPCEGWDEDASHDGHNTLGWRVYCGDWGHVGDYHYTVCAVKPAYMWHGK